MRVTQKPKKTLQQKLRAGVVGCGVFGGYHSGKYAAHPGVDFTGICDPSFEKARALAEKHGVKAFAQFEELLDAIDILTIAASAESHFELARQALEAGVHCMIEKPLATRIVDGEALVKLAKEKDCVIACGHQERLVFNAMGVFDTGERPRHIEARRLGVWNVRGTDVSVAQDLMIHDADLVMAAMGDTLPAVIRVEAAQERSDHADYVAAELDFGGGSTARLEASRLSETLVRTMQIDYSKGSLIIDFVARTFENTTDFNFNPDFADTASGRDPLGANVSQFVASVRNKAKKPSVDGAAGLRALQLIRAVEKAYGAQTA